MGQNPSPFGIPVTLKFGTSSDRNVAGDVLFFETSKIKSSYDAWDSTLPETETGLSDTIHTPGAFQDLTSLGLRFTTPTDELLRSTFESYFEFDVL